ncbi:MAG: SpoVT/AbrB-like protein [Nostoc sp. DedQUE12a]|nr:SpoVT/AbrB-like protein [Nostoc sp. DedQUE12a]
MEAVEKARQNAIAIISPIQKKSLLQTLSTLEPLDEEFPDVDEGLLPLDDIEL